MFLMVVRFGFFASLVLALVVLVARALALVLVTLLVLFYFSWLISFLLIILSLSSMPS